MRTEALGEYDSAERREAAIQEAFRSAVPYVRRYEMALIAPAEVIDSAVQAFRRVRGVRDLLTNGVTADSAQYRTAQRDYYASIEAASDAMRRDLGVSPLGFPRSTPCLDHRTNKRRIASAVRSQACVGDNLGFPTRSEHEELVAQPDREAGYGQQWACHPIVRERGDTDVRRRSVSPDGISGVSGGTVGEPPRRVGVDQDDGDHQPNQGDHAGSTSVEQ
jgi:hypothetical protein